MLAAKMKDFGQLKLRDITKVSGMKSPSAGEFIVMLIGGQYEAVGYCSYVDSVLSRIR